MLIGSALLSNPVINQKKCGTDRHGSEPLLKHSGEGQCVAQRRRGHLDPVPTDPGAVQILDGVLRVPLVLHLDEGEARGLRGEELG